jgi:SAM-dependent methyltransferase
LRTGRIVDLGCGSGILSESLSNAGYDVLGIDLSPDMLRIARRRAPRAVFRIAFFRIASVHRAELPEAIAIVAVGECLNYLFDDRADRRRPDPLERLERLFRRVHGALLPGGIFLFDLAEPGRLAGRTSLEEHWEGADWALLLNATEDKKRNLLVRRITTFRRLGAGPRAQYRRDEEIHRLRLFPRPQTVRLLRKAGFHVRSLPGYSRFRFPAGVTGYFCVAQPHPTPPHRHK